MVTVVLSNSGNDAYRPDLYDPYVVVERVITKTGGGAYNLKATKEGKPIATKREELLRVLDAFQIHVDSPLTILTQDLARSFLQSSDPGSLYKVSSTSQCSDPRLTRQFFMHGTLLQSLVDSYTKIEQHVSLLTRDLERKQTTIPDLKANWTRLLRQSKESQRLIEMQAEVKAIDRELAWAYTAAREQASITAVTFEAVSLIRGRTETPRRSKFSCRGRRCTRPSEP